MDDAPWKDPLLRELRRSRRYLLALLEGVTEAEGEAPPPDGASGCAKWHAGHVGLAERQHLARGIPALGAEVRPGDRPFTPACRLDPAATYPSWHGVRLELARVRALTEAVIVNAAELEPVEALTRTVINLEYAEARWIRRLRQHLGKVDVPDPGGALVQVDTECDAAPRFHVAAFTLRRPGAGVSASPVAVIGEHRRRRAAELLDLGQKLVATRDLRGALRCFEQSARLVRTADAVTYQAWMYSLLGDLRRAEKLCHEAIALDPDFGNPYNDLGTIAVARRDSKAAIEWFERAKRAKRYEPRHFPFMNLGRLYVALGLPDKALVEFEGALLHAPDDAEVRQALDHLRRHLEGE
jgi:tetratricopeptide (TPR) repeat protein